MNILHDWRLFGQPSHITLLTKNIVIDYFYSRIKKRCIEKDKVIKGTKRERQIGE